MHISSLKICNYKSFRESDPVSLSECFNIVVGKNNSGKTAFVEAVAQQFENIPHESPKTVETPQSSPPPTSEVSIKNRIKGRELEEIFIRSGETIKIPRSAKNESSKPIKDSYRSLKNDGLEVKTIISESRLGNINIDGEKVQITADKEHEEIIFNQRNENTISYKKLIQERIKSITCFFDAERLNVGKCDSGESVVLRSDSSNLAEVVTNLRLNNPIRYERYVSQVRKVIPSVKHVSSELTNDGRSVQIKIWRVEKETERSDLAVPLSECGTGVGQVLALLYVVMNADEPRIIIVDEPQSFLHPGAVRRLIGIMKQHPQHQYVMTTHAPSVINASDPDTLLMTELNGPESEVTQLDTSETDDLRRMLTEVGVRLSDVFGADNILWVEGRTEEECFPKILQHIAEESLLGTQILGERQTGDLEGRQATEAFEIYRKLSEGRGLLPPAVGFVFDQEDRTDQELNDLERRGDGQIQFIGRRMYENYLLHPAAIAEILTDLDREGVEYSPEEVNTWIEENGDEYDTDHEVWSDQWEEEVDAASLLGDLFPKLTNARVHFKKTRDTAKLTEWLIENEPGELENLAKLLYVILKDKKTETEY